MLTDVNRGTSRTTLGLPATAGSMINVTRPFLPPFEEFVARLAKVWEAGQLTNAGPMVVELEAQLRSLLGVNHAFFVSNGTVALQLAIKALGITKEVLTTPFSFVATTSSLIWEGCTPVFVDVDPDTLTMDVANIERHITERTTAILATHVYGNACDVDAIERVASTHGLKVLYDAAHAFGARYDERSLCAYGDAATLSFHATKLFHTGEGGAIVTNDDETARQLALVRNFGITGPETIEAVGVNGKASEIHAALGLTVLPHLQSIISRRGACVARYEERLAEAGPQISSLRWRVGLERNHSYHPVFFSGEQDVLAVMEALRNIGVNTRRYFYPVLNRLPFIERCVPMPVAEDAAQRVLCLPLFAELSLTDVDRICDCVLEALRRARA
jgi:dTDP-4-amino-4,6-dideoxygalactose transaminase